MSPSPINRRPNLIGVSAAAAVAIGAASPVAPAAPVGNGQRLTARAGAPTPDLPFEGLGGSSVSLAGATLPPVSSSTLDAVAETAREPGQGRTVLGLLSTALAVVSMGHWYLQLRAKKTATNITTGTLWMVNDALLCGTALATGQGWAAAVPATFATLGAASVYEMWRQGGRTLSFHKWDIVSGVGCCLGWGALLLMTAMPTTSASVGIAMASAVVATATYILATIPMERAMLAAPKPEEMRDAGRSFFKTWLTPTMPYLIGTTAYGTALFSVPEAAWYVYFQPALLLLNNVVLTSCMGWWSYRRIAR